MHFGVPSEEEKEAFTLVLLGNLDVNNFYFFFFFVKFKKTLNKKFR